jgi:hypothetical protein
MKNDTGKLWEGWAFTFCKAAFLVLICTGKFALLILSGLAMICYIIAALLGVKEWRCWAKPPWVTLFWAVVFSVELLRHLGYWNPLVSYAHLRQLLAGFGG